jgi:Protein of unknown function (DUF2809)
MKHSNKISFTIAICLFVVEVLIALFMHDRFIRPFFGDFLIVIFIFYFFKSFTKINDWNLAWLSLAISYLVEILQYLNFLQYIGLSNHKLSVIVMGNSFAWEDMLAYTLGAMVALYFEINFIKYYFPKSDSN